MMKSLWFSNILINFHVISVFQEMLVDGGTQQLPEAMARQLKGDKLTSYFEFWMRVTNLYVSGQYPSCSSSPTGPRKYLPVIITRSICIATHLNHMVFTLHWSTRIANGNECYLLRASFWSDCMIISSSYFNMETCTKSLSSQIKSCWKKPCTSSSLTVTASLFTQAKVISSRSSI